MIELKNENNLENINPKRNIKINQNLNEKLISEDDNSNNKKNENDIILTTAQRIGNEETRITENNEEESYILAQNFDNPSTILVYNSNKNKLNQNKSNEIKNNNILQKVPLNTLDENNENEITNMSIPGFRNTIHRESLQIEQKINSKNDKKSKEQKNNIYLYRLRIILIIIEIFLGLLICISSLFILFLFFKNNNIDTKLIIYIVEPLIILISIIGIIPKKGKNYNKIVITLYLWEGLFLYPFSFYAKSRIKDENIYNISNRILIARIFILSVQFLNLILALIMKINI